MAQRDLTVRPREVQGPVGHARVVIFFYERQRRVPGFRHAHDQIDAGRFVRHQGDGAAQGTDGIENGTGGVGQRCVTLQRGRIGHGPASSDEPAAIGFARDFTLVAALTDHEVQKPGRLFPFGAGTTGAKNGRTWTQEFGLHEQIAEGGMGSVRRRRREHDFGVTGQLDDAPRAGKIGDGHPAQLDVVLGRDADVGVNFQTRRVLAKLGASLSENGLAAFGDAPARLMGGGPEFAGGHIAQVEKSAPAIARRILAPAGDGKIAPAAVAAARAADHDMIAAIGQEVDFGGARVGIGDEAHESFADLGELPRLAQFKLFGEHLGGGVGHALLQEQVRSPERWAQEETPLHRAVQQPIRQGEQAHPLMMGHVRADGDTGPARRQTRRSVIHCLVKSVSAFASFGGEEFKILAGFAGRNHQGHRRGVRSNHEIFRQAAFQTKARHAEGAVLVIQMHVGAVVAGFGNTPRDAAQLAVFDLLPDGPLAGLIEQGVFVIRHDQQRHQVLEHRPAPRSKQRIAPQRDEQTAQREPVLLRNLSLRDGDVAAQARLGRQQIIEAGVIAAFGDVETNGEKLARGIEQKAEIHLGHLGGLPGQGFQSEDALAGEIAGFPNRTQPLGLPCFPL